MLLNNLTCIGDENENTKKVEQNSDKVGHAYESCNEFQ